ncbi:MAG: restriction endonuclease subunit S [Oscillospiraceae bacterium]|nr:restriction endonuclease subunit S [Oscillospiraceae bacterium]
MARLDEVCSINMGQSPESSTYNETGDGIPFFQGNADFGIIHPTVRIWCTSPTKIAHSGDILISVRAPIGALNIADIDCCIGRGLAALTVNEKLSHKKYIWYAIQSKIDELNSKGTGSTFKAISKNILSETEIPLPSLERQQDIATTLDKLTTLISLRKQQLAKLDELVKARFVEMFGESRLNPKSWNIVKLEQIADVGSSKRVFIEELQDEGIPFYRGTEIGSLAEGKKITPELFITRSHYESLCKTSGRPSIGDLLMPSICPDGRIWLVSNDEPFYFKDGRVLWIHPISHQINSNYLRYVIKEKLIADYDNVASGTTFSELKIFALKSLSIMIPPYILQQMFSDFVLKIDNSKLTIENSLDKMEVLKRSLMQKYFG